MNHNKYFRKFGWLLLAFLISGCGEKKPVDDIVLIKQFLTKFERGINLQSQAVIDSLLLDKKKNISSELLDSISPGGKYTGFKIISKSFIMFKDSAEVRLGLRSDSIAVGQEVKEIEKRIRLFLCKKRGVWRVQGFSMEQDSKE